MAKKIQKSLAVFLAVLMMVTITPIFSLTGFAKAAAGTLYYNKSDGKLYDDSSFSREVTAGEYTGSYSGNGATLTLNGFSFTASTSLSGSGTKTTGLVMPENTTINVKGTNTIKCAENTRSVYNDDVYTGIIGNGDLTITGDGTLNVFGAVKSSPSAEESKGIECNNFVMNMASKGQLNITVYDGSYSTRGIISHDTATIKSGKLTIKNDAVAAAETTGLGAYNNITISGGTVNVTMGGMLAFGVFANKAVTVSGGTVNATANGAYCGFAITNYNLLDGIDGKYNVTFSGGTTHAKVGKPSVSGGFALAISASGSVAFKNNYFASPNSKGSSKLSVGNVKYAIEGAKFDGNAVKSGKTAASDVYVLKTATAKKSQSISVKRSAIKVTTNSKGNGFAIGAKAKTALTYKSSNTKVATVSKKGVVTIKGKGSATITITAAASATYKAATKKVSVSVTQATTTQKYVTQYAQNYRKGPGTKYAIVDSFRAGVKVTAVKGTEKKANGHTWIKVVIKGHNYWMAKDIMKKA